MLQLINELYETASMKHEA